MNWDRLFEDLEGQLASEWEAERAVLDAESERLRIAHLTLRDRVRALCADRASVVVEMTNGRRLPVIARTVGTDWFAADAATAASAHVPRSLILVPLPSIVSLSTDHGMLLASLEDAADTPPALRERMTLGFVLRDLARRRVPLHVSTARGDDIHGTIDRAGTDHLDLAVHDAGVARLASAVQGFRIVPFSALVSIRMGGDQRL